MEDDELDGPKFFTRFRGFRIVSNKTGEEEPISPKLSPEERERRIEYFASRANQSLNLFDVNDTTDYSIQPGEKHEGPDQKNRQ